MSMKPEKVKISKTERTYIPILCQRCNEEFCSCCVDFYEVEFDIEENYYRIRPDLIPYMFNLKGKKVCPWCYNRLVDLFNKQQEVGK